MKECLVCGGESHVIQRLDSQSISNALEKMLGDYPPENVHIPNYDIFRCSVCELEFTDPPIPGTDDFYEWIVQHPGYYPPTRWEWDASLDLVRNHAKKLPNRPLVSVDVGCGSGYFLKLLSNIENIRPIGIDLTMSSIEKCRASGLEAYCCDLSEARDHIPDGVDIITAFHLLEHVADPRGFIEVAKKAMRPEGVILISTPFSPTSTEDVWSDDPLNYPPHHLTRWNDKSYHKLAQIFDMDIDFVFQPDRGFIRRSVTSLSLRARSPFVEPKPIRRWIALFQYLLSHPSHFPREIKRQLSRKKLGTQPAPDICVAILKNKGISQD